LRLEECSQKVVGLAPFLGSMIRFGGTMPDQVTEPLTTANAIVQKQYH
jgi:hypothetical protein